MRYGQCRQKAPRESDMHRLPCTDFLMIQSHSKGSYCSLVISAYLGGAIIKNQQSHELRMAPSLSLKVSILEFMVPAS